MQTQNALFVCLHCAQVDLLTCPRSPIFKSIVLRVIEWLSQKQIYIYYMCRRRSEEYEEWLMAEEKISTYCQKSFELNWKKIIIDDWKTIVVQWSLWIFVCFKSDLTIISFSLFCLLLSDESVLKITCSAFNSSSWLIGEHIDYLQY